MGNQVTIPQGEFVYYDGRRFQTTEDNPTSIMHCADSTRVQVQMGRDGAYRGVYSGKVLGDLRI